MIYKIDDEIKLIFLRESFIIQDGKYFSFRLLELSNYNRNLLSPPVFKLYVIPQYNFNIKCGYGILKLNFEDYAGIFRDINITDVHINFGFEKIRMELEFSTVYSEIIKYEEDAED